MNDKHARMEPDLTIVPVFLNVIGAILLSAVCKWQLECIYSTSSLYVYLLTFCGLLLDAWILTISSKDSVDKWWYH